MFGLIIDNITKLLALQNLSKVPTWVIGLGSVAAIGFALKQGNDQGGASFPDPLPEEFEEIDEIDEFPRNTFATQRPGGRG